MSGTIGGDGAVHVVERRRLMGRLAADARNPPGLGRVPRRTRADRPTNPDRPRAGPCWPAVARPGPCRRGAHQGHRDAGRHARQPARRLRPRGGPARHRRHDAQRALHRSRPCSPCSTAWASTSATSRLRNRNVAAVIVTAQLPPLAGPRPAARRHRVVARRLDLAARRHADHDAADGRRRPDPRGRPGRRVGVGLLGRRGPPNPTARACRRRAHRQRRHRGARGAGELRAGRRSWCWS